MNLSKARAIESYKARGRKCWLVFGLIIVLVVAGAGFGVREIGLAYTAKDEQASEKTIEIKSGTDTAGIADQLAGDGLIANARSFKLAVLLAGAKGKLKAGTFELSAALSPHQIVKKIYEGKTKEIKVTIAEGLRLESVANLFEKEGLTKSEDFIRAAKASNYDYSFLTSLPPGASLEGFLFPDTYSFTSDAESSEIINKLLKNFEQKITPLLPLVEKSDLSLSEIVTLAAMVEKEVPGDADRKAVAGVFFNRLNAEMPLQSDSTLAYIKKEEKVNFSAADVAIDDAYNTYQNAGLPPGPINSPSLSAIEAVLEPSKNDYYYFVSDVKSGKTYFSKTLEEHNQNVAKYLEL